MMTPLYTINDLRLTRGDVFTLEVDHLELSAGSIYALFGPNGSGKSSLLQVLALLMKPDRGELQINGKRIIWNSSLLKKWRRIITLVDQSPYLFNDTVAANVAFGLKVRGVLPTDQVKMVGEALETVGLSGFEDRAARQLSGGQMQRVALARALVLDPKVLLLDEPTANIDRQNHAVFMELIASLPGRGMSVLLSTHDLGQANRLGAQVLYMSGGHLSRRINEGY